MQKHGLRSIEPFLCKNSPMSHFAFRVRIANAGMEEREREVEHKYKETEREDMHREERKKSEKLRHLPTENSN